VQGVSGALLATVHWADSPGGQDRAPLEEGGDRSLIAEQQGILQEHLQLFRRLRAGSHPHERSLPSFILDRGHLTD
jgi:hypothetical protein